MRDLSLADNWAEHRSGPGNTGSLPEAPDVDPAVNDCSCIYDGEFDGEPAVVDGTIYVAEQRTGGRVLALDAHDGSVQWTSDDVRALATPAVDYGRVFVAAFGETRGEGRLVALDAEDGTVEWGLDGDETAFESRPTDPTVAYEKVYVVGHETLYAFDVADGTVRWENALDVTFDAYTQPPAVTDGRLFVVTEGPLYALDPRTGEVLWQTDETEAHETFQTDGDVLGATPDRLVADEVDGVLGIYDPETGERTGEVEAVDRARDLDIAVTGDAIYALGDEEIHAVHAEGGGGDHCVATPGSGVGGVPEDLRDLDLDGLPRDAEADELRADVIRRRLDGRLPGLEAPRQRRLEGDLDLAVAEPLGLPAALDLVEGVADPHVGRVVVGRAAERRRVLAGFVQRARQLGPVCGPPNLEHTGPRENRVKSVPRPSAHRDVRLGVLDAVEVADGLRDVLDVGG
jgi:hypothetical protein